MDLTKELSPLYDVIYTPWYLSNPFLMGAAIFLCGGFFILGYFFYRKKGINKNPEQLFVETLDFLELQKHHMSTKQFYSLFIDAVKKYMSFLYYKNLTSFTDQELIFFIDSKAPSFLEATTTKHLKELLQHAQSIKFSEAVGDVLLIDTVLHLGRALIQKEKKENQ